MRIFLFLLLAALGLAVTACEKQQSETERQAEIERRVQERLAAERQAEQQQKLDAREAELDARENALTEKANTPEPAVTAPRATESTPNESGTDSEPNSYATFYRRLEPYGSWMETNEYGYVFQPNIAESADWRPYTDGYWAYTDAGWTWISSEGFGWATYHYGRWIRLRSVGWVWVPGEQWAPAWVSWRKGNDYIGWAPLPPEAHFDRKTGIHNWADSYYNIGPGQYCFVPRTEFGRRLTAHEIVPPQRNVTIINQTTNVTNITYNNSTVVDRGPSYDELRARSRHPIEKLRLERTNNFAEGAVARSGVVTLPTAEFHPPKPAVRPSRVTRRLDHPVIERGWTGIQNSQEAEQVRQKMRTEAIPPANSPPKRSVGPKQPASIPAQPTPAPARTLAPTVNRAKMIPVGTPAPLPDSSPDAAAKSPQIPDERPNLNRRDAKTEKRQERRQGRAERETRREQEMLERGGETPAASARPLPKKEAGARKHPQGARNEGRKPPTNAGSTASPTP